MSPRYVLLFVIDGLRPDALQQADTPCIDELAAQGAYTWQAQTVTPSISLPCHASLFHAVPPARHGVVDNVWAPPEPPVPSLIDVVHEAGLGTAAFYSWEPLRDLSSPEALDIAYYHRLGDPEDGRDLEIGERAADYVVEERPAFAFVYLGGADETGHRHGWMSEPYVRAVERADRAIGLVLERLRSAGARADTVALVMADHGGHDHDHSAGLAEDLTIPWIISGAGIRRGHQIASAVNVIDTAPTLVHLLAISAPAAWRGRVVTEAIAA
ncbi:MAG: 2,3-bisphosphoglycerate-independent phosphoglycerate mutase [Anaerolineales bacterium]|nr:2,3-bisphosphoglycerate-independent phosphoglycerate mutase [Anaerolineales bacterium]